MKFIFFTLGALLAFQALACDICSSAFEIIPNERKSSFGLYYSTVYRNGFPSKQTKHSGHLNYLGSEVKEIYNIYDLRYRHAFKERIFGDLVLPIRNVYQGIDRARKFDHWGLGDIQLQLTYRVIQPNAEKRINHRLDFTLGGDLPTGTWTDSINQIVIDPIYQMGSGSFDFWGSFSYVMRLKNMGLSAHGMYRRNNANPLNYKFGDALVGDFSMFFVLDFGKWKIMPRTGMFYEQGFAAQYRNLNDLHSGERLLSTQHGFSIFFKKFQLNGIFRNVIFHQTQGVEVRQKYFGQFALIYNFGK
jgi:hypothetical protein